MVFKKIIFQNSLMANETPSRPPPLHGKCHLKFPFWFSAPFPKGGGEVSPLSPDRKQMWKFWSIFKLKLDALILKTKFISSRRVSKMHFSCPFRGCQNEGTYNPAFWEFEIPDKPNNHSMLIFKTTAQPGAEFWGQPSCRVRWAGGGGGEAQVWSRSDDH